nr:hypothetical protein MACL_00000091 [Theileria orientalis]
MSARSWRGALVRNKVDARASVKINESEAGIGIYKGEFAYFRTLTGCVCGTTATKQQITSEEKFNDKTGIYIDKNGKWSDQLTSR